MLVFENVWCLTLGLDQNNNSNHMRCLYKQCLHIFQPRVTLGRINTCYYVQEKVILFCRSITVLLTSGQSWQSPLAIPFSKHGNICSLRLCISPACGWPWEQSQSFVARFVSLISNPLYSTERSSPGISMSFASFTCCVTSVGHSRMSGTDSDEGKSIKMWGCCNEQKTWGRGKKTLATLQKCIANDKNTSISPTASSFP